jgi:hypothetical protein
VISKGLEETVGRQGKGREGKDKGIVRLRYSFVVMIYRDPVDISVIDSLGIIFLGSCVVQISRRRTSFPGFYLWIRFIENL